MVSIIEHSKLFAQEARKENKGREALVKCDKAFVKAYNKLITIIGRC
jgi:hypothetical protein